jgi:hypothetical protein
LDLFDPKPKLAAMDGQDLPASVRGSTPLGQQTLRQEHLPLVGATAKFVRAGNAGIELTELLPHTAKVVDDLCLIRSMHTDAVEHAAGVTFLLTGTEQPGRPTIGAWTAYGLGSANRNLPEYVALLSGSTGQALQSRYWGNGFLPGRYQGVEFRSSGDPVLYLADPPGIDRYTRRQQLDRLQELNRIHLGELADPEIATRINCYEMAFRMQTSVPELMDISREPAEVLELYGAVPGQASFANNCLLARRLAERGVRFIQLCHRDWDHHGGLPNQLRQQCLQTDQASAALIRDLKRRDLLKDTLVIWGGEFGRTAYGQGKVQMGDFGRDHHARCSSIWMAGGGVKGGIVHGATDGFGFNLAKDGVHVHDLNATVLYLLGIDHTRLTYRYQGRDFRLTDVAGSVVQPLLA